MWSRLSSRLDPPERRLYTQRRHSPDANAVLGFDVVGVAFLDAEGRIPGVDIAQRREGADLPGRVRIGHELLAQSAIAHHRPPHLPPSEEDALVAGEAVEDRRRLAMQRH